MAEETERSDMFLNLYKTMEQILTNKYYNSGETVKGSVVVRFMNDRDGKPFRDKLDLCREIRNLLAHHADVGGESIVEPSQAIVDFLQSVVDYLQRPPLALDFSTRWENIVKANLTQKALSVMKRMEQRGFSHIPVFENGKMVGVFSISTVFSYMVENRNAVLDEQTEIADFYDILSIEKHKNERFMFVGRNATVSEVRAAFEAKRERSRRLAVVFITENGRKDSRLLGMLTPWDVL